MWQKICKLVVKLNEMKHWSITAFLLLFFVFTGFSQKKLAISSPIKELVSEQLDLGKFVFYISTDITEKETEESASYYSMYFDIEHDETTGMVTATMKQNDSKSRHILVRFFVALGINEIEVDGTNMQLESYYQKYLKKGNNE